MRKFVGPSKIAAVLCLTTIWSAGCSWLVPEIVVKGGGDRGCGWTREIHAGPHVRAALGRALGAARAEARLEDRDELRDFVRSVGDHNETRRAICEPSAGKAATP
jgi:hypothetical protein